MNKTSLIFLFITLNFLLVETFTRTCGEEEIDNCLQCGTGENSDSCAKCDNAHFPLLENLLCLPCDDPIYNQAGCEGECDSSSYSNSGFAYCNNCKDGYYNVEGLCHKCDENAPACKNCTYDNEAEPGVSPFKCLQCLNEEEYILDSQMGCIKCNDYVDVWHCKKCHFTGIGYSAECVECESGYYLNTEKTCSSCGDFYVSPGKLCYQCSNEIKMENCFCTSGYVKVNDNCISCPSNCDACKYNDKDGSTECYECSKNYALNSEKECINCGPNCQYCFIDKNNNPICIICKSGYTLEDNKCWSCPTNCDQCILNEYKNETICTSCSYYSCFDKEKKNCIRCNDIDEIGGSGCSTCRYNESKDKYECLSCDNSYYYHNYAFVQNTFQCLSNQDRSKTGLYGCITAEYIENSKTYQCLNCKHYIDDYFIPVITDKSCTNTLSKKCLEAEKIGDSYSCLKCSYDYAIVENLSSHLKNCYERKNDLSYCLEGIYSDYSYSCSQCVDNAILTNSNNKSKCSCEADSFSKNSLFCYKCDDALQGNQGCVLSEGCEYFIVDDHLNCRKCKEGYVEYTQGQCFSCSLLVPNCNKCHYNKTSDDIICDSCVNSIYSLNAKENACELNECEEYPEISPGCIICKDQLDEYKQNNKCQRCKNGYFKTKEEKCIYCNSEENGGHACSECEYEKNDQGADTQNIICKSCYPTYSLFNKDSPYQTLINNTFLSNEGKCYDCQVLFTDKCTECVLAKNSNGKESLKCISCKEGYYLTDQGNCVRFTELLTKIDNCMQTHYISEDIELITFKEEYYESIDDDYFNYEIRSGDYNIFINKLISSGMEGIDVYCINCNHGYYKNNEGKCEELSLDKCSFSSIFKNFVLLKEPCVEFCFNEWQNYDYVNIELRLSQEQNYFNIHNIYYNYYEEYFSQFGEDSNIKACLFNSGEGGENAPINLKNCRRATYFPENNTYTCTLCNNRYTLDNDSLCLKEREDYTCSVHNFGTELLPNYQCYYIDIIGMNNYRDIILNFTLVTNENGQTEFIETKGDLEGCVEAVANTTYTNSKYNCTKCSFMYVPYYNKYFGRIICQNIKDKIIRKNSISSEAFNETTDKIKATNGICEREYLFTPDGEYCYKCDSEDSYGMPGCKGKCSFSLLRDKALKCEGTCKEGYIESSEGICSPCEAVSKGCHQCHYETEYPSDYVGIKRQRRFVCDFCEGGFIQGKSGECLDCLDLGLSNCTKCELNPLKNQSYICSNCIEGFFVNSTGQCETCDAKHFQSLLENKCIKCDNTSAGGIDKCNYCNSDGEQVVCDQCLPGYILLTNNNTCLDIFKNKELQKFLNCLQLTMENGKLYCSKCNAEYSLVKKNDIKECIYIKSLYDKNFEINYQNYFYTINNGAMNMEDYKLYIETDYIYKRYKDYQPCQEVDNLGTEENPLYSCTKCYEILNKPNNYTTPVRITEKSSNVSYCINPKNYSELDYCTEAIFKIRNGEEEYNCTECVKNYVLTRNKYTNTYYCQSMNATTKCVVIYCKTCNPFNGYICEECLPDYSINSLTGSCVKNTEVIPAVTWKDIYRLNMNGVKKINNRNIYGPSLVMRGITTNQINSRHAFMIYLTFKIKHRIRYLEEEENKDIRLPTICEVLSEVDRTEDDVNMVEYECIGNQTNEQDLTDYTLDNIEEESNSSLIKKTNLKDLVTELKAELGDLGKLQNKKVSTFTYDDLQKIAVFKMDNKIDNITADDFKFKIQINGQLNKEIVKTEPITLKRELELAEVDDNTKADCKLILGLNKIANLSCDLNVESHKDIKTFSFRTFSVYTDDKSNEIYLANFNDITLINSKEKNDDNKNKTKIIIIAVVCSVVGAALIAVGIYFLIKKLKTTKINKETNIISKGEENVVKTNEVLGNDDMSGNRVS